MGAARALHRAAFREAGDPQHLSGLLREARAAAARPAAGTAVLIGEPRVSARAARRARRAPCAPATPAKTASGGTAAPTRECRAAPPRRPGTPRRLALSHPHGGAPSAP